MNTVTYQENSLGTMGIELEFELLCGEHIISVAEYKATIRIFWKTQNLPKLQAALDDTSLSLSYWCHLELGAGSNSH